MTSCSTLLVIREMKITTITAHLLGWLSKRTQIPSNSEDVDKSEPSCTVSRKVNWYSHCRKQYEGFLEYDPGIPHLDVYPKET